MCQRWSSLESRKYKNVIVQNAVYSTWLSHHAVHVSSYETARLIARRAAGIQALLQNNVLNNKKTELVTWHDETIMLINYQDGMLWTVPFMMIAVFEW